MNLRTWWMLNDWKFEKHTKSFLRAIWRFLTSPGLWIIIMVLFGLGIIAGGVWAFTHYCDAGQKTVGWCGVVGKEFPWTVITGIATVPAVILTWYWRDQHKRKDIQIAQDGQVTERFTRAIEQLGSEKLAVRLGAIYALERIAGDSPRDLWTIIETLSAYIRETAPVDEGMGGLSRWHNSEAVIRPVADVQAALTVLGRLPRSDDPEQHYIDLKGTDLRGADLSRANFSRVVFAGSDMENAALFDSDVSASSFTGVNLTGAILFETDLTAADMSGACLLGVHGLERRQLLKANIYHDTKLPPKFEDLIPCRQ